MAMIDQSDLVSLQSSSDDHRASYVDWPAIIGGIVLATGVSVVLLTFGAALGLTLTSVADRQSGTLAFAGIGIGLWFIWVQVSSFMAGAYLTGRMRRRFFDATEKESDVRDGIHGLLVWGGAIVVGAFLATSGIGAATSVVGTAAGGAASAIAAALPSQSGTYVVDTLMRPAPGTAASSTSASGSTDDSGAMSGEVMRLLANAGTGDVSADDKAYLASLVASRTGLSEADATARVDAAVESYYEARTQVAEAAETARRVGIISAFLIAASLLVSAAGAYWSATTGGNHRDDAVEFDQFFRRIN